MVLRIWGGSGGWPSWLSVGLETQALPGYAPRESADKVVLHMGKYEELIVCSHEIAASTAQLVAASKVRPCGQPGLASTPCAGERERESVCVTAGWGVIPGAHPDLCPPSPR